MSIGWHFPLDAWKNEDYREEKGEIYIFIVWIPSSTHASILEYLLFHEMIPFFQSF